RTSRLIHLERCGQVRSQILDHHTEESTLDAPILHEAVHHPSAEVRRNRKTDSLVSTTVCQDFGVDSDKAPFCVDKRATGITRVDPSVGLNEIFIHLTGCRTILRTDYPFRHSLADAK